MSPEWTRLLEALKLTAGQLAWFAEQLAGPVDERDEEWIAERSVFLAADLAMAASGALESRYPIGGGR